MRQEVIQDDLSREELVAGNDVNNSTGKFASKVFKERPNPFPPNCYLNHLFG